MPKPKNLYLAPEMQPWGNVQVKTEDGISWAPLNVDGLFGPSDGYIHAYTSLRRFKKNHPGKSPLVMQIVPKKKKEEGKA